MVASHLGRQWWAQISITNKYSLGNYWSYKSAYVKKMLVEDEVHLLDVMRKLLKADGSETYLAVNKNQLFDLAIANRPGQVVSYSMMLG